ncbi:MAG: bifunctional diaminohydroxyphosphoribosylaminopyrimidine deaminase/5-amino-6-(5-phosphoribosylamino)uracil reductase RibD, partial [Planctomycetota bacterium]
MMRRAIALARRGLGRVEPNPPVGCVIVRHGRIVAEGWHRRFGGPHAEIDALRRCPAQAARGATVYVSLEPCAHFGKTPPCADALIAAGAARVVAAMRDPHPHVAGKGFRRLRQAGIRVETGVLRDEAAELLAPYLTRLHLARPYVIAKWAQSLDGKLAAAGGDSKWISNERSRREVHRLRARVDVILVGAETLRRDDPLLTARDVPLRRRAARVVLDGRLRVPLRCRLVDTARDVSTWVFTSAGAARTPKADRLRAKGVNVAAMRSRNGRLDLRAVLTELARREVTNLLVEGGADVLTGFLGERLVDEAWVFTAPI